MPYTIIWHKLKMHTVVVVTILVTCLPPAMADDTDIFLGSSAPSASGTNPNVLFILDNSGSMQSDARDSDGVSTGQTRLEAMKSAFAEIMSTVSGINVGLMRFNGPGGSIEYPITNVNLSLASTDFQSVPDMLISEDDANELAANGAVTLDDTSLRIGHTTQLNTTQITGYIQHQEDDREESTSGPEIDGTYFNMNTYQINGLRYFDLNIPTGASIANAWLEFTSPTSGYTGDISIEISAQSADNPARFTGNDSDLDTRYQNERSSNTVVWGISNSQNWDMGQVYRSPNLRDVVQEIVDRADWDANDAMVFLVKGLSGNGQRAGTLYRNDSSSTQGSTGSNTKLVVEYSTSSSTTQTVTGLRFQQVNIPQGATVTAARINFFASIAHSTVDGLKLRIRAENTDNAAPFTATPFSLSARAKTASEVIWEPDSDWPLGESLTGPDVTSLVQQVVNRTDWCGNNALALYLEPTADSPVGWRDAYAFDDALEQHAELVVSFSGGESGCINQIWSQRVNSAEDDAEEPPGRRSRADNRSTDLDIESSIVSGIRFENIPAVQGGTILEAYLDVTASGNNSGNMSFTIRGHDDDNAPAFVNARRNITKRSQTSASVTWTPPDFVNAQVYRSPNLASIVQEIVDRSNWSVGNSLALILTASSSSTDRDISTFEAGPGVAPKLILKLANGATQSSPLTVASHLNDLVQNMDARTWTPIVDSLYEAALYFQGKDVYYGASRELFAQSDGFTSRQYKRVSVPGSYTGGTVVRDARCTDENLDSSYCASEIISSTPSAPKYISPITNECQNNHIVLLTDGEANNNHSIDKIRSLTSTPSCDSDASDADEKCGRTLVEWMANNDMATAFPNSRSTITTHTIAFNLSNNGAVDFLQDLATLGGGTFNTANTSAELSNAFDAILRNVISRNSTFTSPGATVNQFNQLTNREEIYFSVFKPEIRPLWSGNLKRYKLRGDPAVIVDVNDQEAIDTQSGFFKSSAKSIWSDNIDGPTVALGGAASKLPSNVDQRKVYTYLSGASTPSTQLIAPSNVLDTSNAEITTSLLNAIDATQRNELLNWIRGEDVLDVDGDGDSTNARLHIGDPLHSVPTLVTYGGDESSPDISIFFGTNEGFVHAINASTGIEHFAFMPEELLSNIRLQYENSSSNLHPYGMDGSIVSWVNDVDFDGTIEPADGDIVYLYTGMRRGGNQYYALDVTQRDQPEILWVIHGGSGDFAQLGQTWSKPVKSKVKIDNVVHDVLFFGGGFDPAVDATPSGRVKSTIGNAIYMVDAVTGDRLWMASDGILGSAGLNAPLMEYAIPSDLSVVDINFDGLADQIYVGDLGGQLWRFDISNGNTASTLIDGGVIAALASDDLIDARRFFFHPDVALVGSSGVPKLAIALGSGHVNEPLETTTVNRFYVVLQENVFTPPENGYTTLTETNLDDRTNVISDSPTSSGWYITLENSGEKQLSSPLTVSGNLIFSTYEPSVAVNACSGATGIGRVYLMDIGTAEPNEDLNNSNNVDKLDRHRVLASPSIPPTPKLLFPEDATEPVLLIGPEQPLSDVSLVDTDEWERTFWYENQ